MAATAGEKKHLPFGSGQSLVLFVFCWRDVWSCADHCDDKKLRVRSKLPYPRWFEISVVHGIANQTRVESVLGQSCAESMTVGVAIHAAETEPNPKNQWRSTTRSEAEASPSRTRMYRKKFNFAWGEKEPIRHAVPLLRRRLYQQEEATTAPPRLLDAAAVVVVLSGIH
jgi:hypothetical protein